MSYYQQTPYRYNNYSSKRMLSPTTANSKSQSQVKSTSNLMSSVHDQINDIIAEAQMKHDQNHMGIQAVYKTNQDLLNQLDPYNEYRGQRDLRMENQQLKRQLNDALREIMKLRKIIGQLENENDMLRRKAGVAGKGYDEGNQIFRDLEQLRAEGQNLRQNVIGMLRRR